MEAQGHKLNIPASLLGGIVKACSDAVVKGPKNITDKCLRHGAAAMMQTIHKHPNTLYIFHVGHPRVKEVEGYGEFEAAHLNAGLGEGDSKPCSAATLRFPSFCR